MINFVQLLSRRHKRLARPSLGRLGMVCCLASVATAAALNGGDLVAQTPSNTPVTGTAAVKFVKLRPGLHPITLQLFSQGTLVVENGCLRLRQQGDESMAIIWPDTSRMPSSATGVVIRDHATNWSAKPGDLIRLGGKTVLDITGIAVDNPEASSCAPPYFVAYNIVKSRR